MGKTFDVVAFHHKWSPRDLNLAHGCCTAGFVQMTVAQQGIGIGQYRQHCGLFFAAHSTQDERPALHTEQCAIASGLVQKIVQPPGPHFVDLFKQGFKWQRVFAVAQ